MTESDTLTLPVTPGLRSHNLTIYRDTPLAFPQPLAARPIRSSVRALVQPDDRASSGMFLGLVAMTLPVVAYSLVQAWHLCATGALDHAVRALVP